MCIVKKYNLELKRSYVSNHCVATLKDAGLVDMCLFSGEGKPSLLGGYVLSARQAYDLGKALVNTSAAVGSADRKHAENVIKQNIFMAYQLLRESDPEKAQKLKELFDLQIVRHEPTEDHGYIG